MTRILIGADIAPTQSNTALFSGSGGGISELIGEDLVTLMSEMDYRIANLETPLTDTRSPIAKCGPTLRAATSTVKGIRDMGIDLLTLANNHIMDQGVQGLSTTVSLLDAHGIAHLGTGENLASATKPYIATIGNLRLGVYACAEHEFSIAGNDSPGANPWDDLESLDHLRALRQDCDTLVVLYHGGKELYRYPSPRLRRLFRKMADAGADLVVAQQTHCICCVEEYHGATLVYGQGNFIFDYSNDEHWQTSLLIELAVDDKGHRSVTYHPIRKDGARTRMAKGDDAREILDAFHRRGQEIQQAGQVERLWNERAQREIDSYLRRMSGAMLNNLPVRALNRLCFRRLTPLLLRLLYRQRHRLAILNTLTCEPHREIFSTALNKYRNINNINT